MRGSVIFGVLLAAASPHLVRAVDRGDAPMVAQLDSDDWPDNGEAPIDEDVTPQQPTVDQFSSDYTAANDEATGPPPAFNEQLAPYGRWVYMQGLGWVWSPDPSLVGTDFQPYASGGQWVSTTDGWSFDSSWPFGWATFHYGRWLLDGNYGWVWIPGNVWGPSWVDWRVGGGYVGWAPLPPVGFSLSFGFSPWWCFVPVASFTNTNVFVHRVPRTVGNRVFVSTRPVSRSVVVGGARWNRGPAETTVVPRGTVVTPRPSQRPTTIVMPRQSVAPNVRSVPVAPPAMRSLNNTPRAVSPPVGRVPPPAARVGPPPAARVAPPPAARPMAPPQAARPMAPPPAARPAAPPVHMAPPPMMHGPAQVPHVTPVNPGHR